METQPGVPGGECARYLVSALAALCQRLGLEQYGYWLKIKKKKKKKFILYFEFLEAGEHSLIFEVESKAV